MWDGKRVSVVLMTYAERDSIRRVIEGFFGTGVVDEVLVVDNNAQPGTVEEVRQTTARLVHEPLQGYGHAIRRGLSEAQGDLVVLAEPDGTFLPPDIVKLLAYSNECEVVFGTRTTRELIWSGANMEWFLRWGNWGVAKLMEALYNTSHLSDVGCTYRLLKRPSAQHVAANMTVGGSHAGVEIMLLTILSGVRFVEVPVNYLPRVGTSSVTGKPITAVVLGLRMIVADPALPAPGSAPAAPAFAVRARPFPAGRRRAMSSTHFDTISAAYDDSLPAHVVDHYLGKRVQFVLDHCRRGAGLDVGCGTGVLAARLAAAGYEMAGVDPSEGMLEVLRARAPEVNAIRASGTSLPFGDDRFDVVLSVAVMHHIAAPDDVRRTLFRDGEGDEAWRPRSGVGPQPSQPLLGSLDGAGPSGHRRRTPDSRRGVRRRSTRRRLRDPRVEAARHGPRFHSAQAAASGRDRRARGGGHTGRAPRLCPQRHPCGEARRA